MASVTMGSLAARSYLSGSAPVVTKSAKSSTKISGRSRLHVESNVRLVHVKQTTAQKIASMSYQQGYIGYEVKDIEFTKSKMVVGADTSPGSTVDVIIPIDTISGTHAELLASKDSVLVKDLGSKNGTFVDGQIVNHGEVCVALPGQVITFEPERGVSFTVVLDEEHAKMTPKQVAVEIAESKPAYTSEADLEHRVLDRAAWIAAFNAKSKGKTASSPAASSSEADLAARVADRAAWIANAKVGASPAASSSEASLEARVADRAAWIANAKVGASPAASSSEASLEARVAERTAWIANHKTTESEPAAFTSEASLGARVADRAAWISKFNGAKSSPAPFTSEASLADRLKDRSAWVQSFRGEGGASGGKKLRVAINGFGRIGRNFVRCLESRGPDAPMEIVALNDSGGVKQATHLLKYDSILGTFDAEIRTVDDTTFTLNGRPIKVVSSRNPLDLPWKEMGVDIVIESTGVFIDEEGAGKHLTAGAKKVVITAPGKGSIPTYVMGVNAHEMTGEENIISNASCTTNGMACFVKVLEEKFGIVKGMMTTTHSYTGDQRLLDNSHRDARRARAAALNIVPTSTGAAKAVALVLPSVKGKLNGIALRVPTPNVSVVDLVVQTEKKTTAEEVNAAFREAAAGELKGILAVADEPLVSSDFKGTNVSSTVDAALTMCMGDDYVKVVAWYDNEWGYTQRVVDLTLSMAEKGF